jgi:hypothetical protein
MPKNPRFSSFQTKISKISTSNRISKPYLPITKRRVHKLNYISLGMGFMDLEHEDSATFDHESLFSGALTPFSAYSFSSKAKHPHFNKAKPKPK